jgi:hypothetical protein
MNRYKTPKAIKQRLLEIFTNTQNRNYIEIKKTIGKSFPELNRNLPSLKVRIIYLLIAIFFLDNFSFSFLLIIILFSIKVNLSRFNRFIIIITSIYSFIYDQFFF